MRGTRLAAPLIHRRGIHLQGEPALRLLTHKLNPYDDDHRELKPQELTFRVSPSRQLNRPVVDVSGTIIPLDIHGLQPAALEKQLRKAKVRSGSAARNVVKGMYSAWRHYDLLRFKLRVTWKPCPMGGTDIKVALLEVVADDFALYRQPDIAAICNTTELHQLETKAKAAGLFYHKTKSGNIAAYGYGAGVAMSTMDALSVAGGKPANFLDGGGGATEANVKAALDVVTSDKDANVIFINSFGGLTKTDMIAQGIIDFVKNSNNAAPVPMVVRLRGTGEAKAKRILEEANLPHVQYIPDLRAAAARAVELASVSGLPSEPSTAETQPVSTLSPVLFCKDGQYERTISNMMVKENTPVLIMGTGKASAFHNGIAQSYGTNIVSACAPGKGGSTFLSKPVFGSLKEALSSGETPRPEVVSVFVPPKSAADAVIECIEHEVPLVVAYAEGVPTQDQLRIQAVLRSQSRTRLIGPNCPGIILPHSRVKLGIQPLSVHYPGSIGLASRSGTISYELASQTSALGLGQSVVFGLGGDPFPGTRTWEALRVMLDDNATKVICLIGEVGGQMEEEAAAVYADYLKNLGPGEKAKPVVGFIAGQSTERGKMYGHAGAIWYEDWESAASKKKCWTDAGFIMAPTLGDVGDLIREQAVRVGAI